MFFLILLFVIFILICWWCLRVKAEGHIPELIKNYCRFNDKNATPTLFEKYNGLDTVERVVDDAVTNLLNEPSLANVFAVVGQPGHRSGTQLKSLLDLQFAYLFGGPFIYPSKSFTRGVCVDGRSMKASHCGLKITTAQFNTFIGILANTLVADGVSQADVDKIAPQLNATMSDIVEVV